MYYQNQFRYRTKGKPILIKFKRFSWQLMAVLIIILILLLFKYTKGSVSTYVNENFKACFYSDLTKKTNDMINNAYPYIKNYFNNISNEVKEEEFIITFLPLEGKITSEFGNRIHPQTKKEEMHTGVDIDAKEGTEVKAVFDGTVEKIDETKSWGNMIVIQHKNGYRSMYAHLSKINKKQGDVVKQGDVIALSGNTGASTGPHLHFELSLDGEPLDPIEFIKNN